MQLPMNPDHLHEFVIRAGGVLDVSALDLRRARRAGSLKWRVRREIGRWLDRANLHWWPERIPDDQDQRLLLYASDSDAGQLIAIAFRLAERDRRNAEDVAA